MKIITTFIIFYLGTILCYSQPVNNTDTTVTFTSDKLNISYSPSNLFSKISIATNKFASGRQGIEFSLTTKQKLKTPNIRIDSIILKSSVDKILTLNNPYRDTVYYRKDGGLSLMTIHWLNNTQLKMLRQEIITTIILTVDEKPLIIKITKKSQKQFNEVAKKNL